MNNFRLYTLLASGLTTISMGSSQAQSATFEGFYGQAGIGYESVSPSLSYGNINITDNGVPVASLPMSSSVSNSKSFTGALAIGYNFAITKDFLLGIGAEYAPMTSSKANFSGTISNYGTINGQYNKENSYNLYLSPATPIGKDGLLYGKVGYTGASIKSQYDGNTPSKSKLTGYALGIGYKQFIATGLYGFGEINYASYNNFSFHDTASSGTLRATQTTTINANAINFLIGIGYKF